MGVQRKQSEACIYHVTARGTGKQLIFEDDFDRREFLSLLEKAMSDACVDLYAWCLMGNHVHLLLHAPIASVSESMRTLLGSYARFFNRRHERTGHLFQERFRSEAIEDDEYLLTVLRYIHRNPDEAGLARFDSYRWSSYKEYLGRSRYCSTSFIASLFDGPEDYRALHEMVNEDALLPIDKGESGTRQLSDDELIKYARRLLGDIKLASIKSLERDRRNSLLRVLRNGGLSVRQIERLTGISKSVVARAQASARGAQAD